MRLTEIFVANATEEFFVRKRPLYEVVGQLGMWGTIINGIQASALEHKKWKESTWSGENSMILRPSFLDSALHSAFQSDFWWLTQPVRISWLRGQHGTESHYSDGHLVYCRPNALSSCLLGVFQSELAFQRLLRSTLWYVPDC